MLKNPKGLWYLLPFSLRERLEAPNRFEVRKEVDEVLKNFESRRAEVLDVGAGDCFTKKFFVNHNYSALDLKTGDNPSVIKGDAHNLPFKNSFFDIVLCLEVLEHIFDFQVVLKEIFRVLKSRGILILSTPLMSVGFHEDFYRFTPLSLEKILRNTGFEIKKINPIGGYFRMLGWQISKLSYLVKKPKNIFFMPFYYLMKIPLGFVFQIFIPFVLFCFDWLDREKKETCGYAVLAVKP